jgi:hypothetical protein
MMARMPLPARTAVALAAGLAALAAQQAPAQDPSAGPKFTFSAGPFERALALIDPAALVHPPPAQGLPPSELAERDSAATWKQWAAALRAAKSAQNASAERAWLAAFAHFQGRSDDAWEHLAHAGGDGGRVASVLPLLFPGVGPQALASWPTLEDGALLTPALPPPSEPAAEIRLGTGRVRQGSSKIEGLQIGQARIALELRVEGDGIQVECTHLSGEPARLRVLLPVPPDFELHSEYLDWSELEGVGLPREIALVPGSEPVILFGRYRPRKLEWTTRVPSGLPAQAQRDGLLLVATKTANVAGLAAGLQQLLELRVEVRELATDQVEPPFPGLVVDLRDGELTAAKRDGLVSVAERFALAPPR